METKKVRNTKNIEIRVQFEYLNDNDILELSKEYKVKISLDEKTDFETNKKNILSQANFKTKEERNCFHMFNKSKKKFLTQNSDFEQYINTKSSIILINTYEYCDKILQKLKESLDLIHQKSKYAYMIEIKKEELANELTSLEKYFDVDIFADYFIFKNGLEILLNIIKDNYGDIRLYALRGISKLLSFEDAIDFFLKNEGNLDILFTSFIGNNELKSEFAFFDVIINLIASKNEIISLLINLCNEYFFKKIIKFLDGDNKDNDLKKNILFFINIILKFVEQKNQYKLIFELTNVGIFDALKNCLKSQEESLFEQIDLLEDTLKYLLEENEYKDNKYDIIKEKFNNYIENKRFYKIQNLIIKTNSEDKEIKTEAINELNNILKDNDSSFDLIYEAYIKNDNLEKMNVFYLYFIKLFESDENNINNFINSAKKYSEEKKTKPLYQFIEILNNPEPNSLKLKIDTFSFINNVLIITSYFSNDSIFLELLYIFNENEIFEYIESEELEEDLNKEVLKFKEIIKNNISKLEKSKEKKYQLIINKFEKIEEKKVIDAIKDLFLEVHNSSGTIHTKAVKKIINILYDENNFKLFFKMFVENGQKNLNYSFFEIFSQYCVGRDESCMKFVQIIDDYEKQLKINCFEKIINYLDENQNELVQLKAFKLINTLLSINDKKYCYKLLNKFNKLGMFEHLNNLIKSKEIETQIKNQLEVIFTFLGIVLENNKNGEHYDAINEKYKKLKETKNLYENIIDDFIIFDGK